LKQKDLLEFVDMNNVVTKLETNTTAGWGWHTLVTFAGGGGSRVADESSLGKSSKTLSQKTSQGLLPWLKSVIPAIWQRSGGLQYEASPGKKFPRHHLNQ
jgi:hypothetical protein